jgi:hypothetical protein
MAKAISDPRLLGPGDMGERPIPSASNTQSLWTFGMGGPNPDTGGMTLCYLAVRLLSDYCQMAAPD